MVKRQRGAEHWVSLLVILVWFLFVVACYNAQHKLLLSALAFSADG